MKTYPLASITLEEAKEKQFKLIDAMTEEFSGSESLTRGDLGVKMGLNKPLTTFKCEKVIAKFFDSEKCVLVRGSGTSAIRYALFASLKCGDEILVHDAPVYPTTEVSFDMMGLKAVKVDFGDISALKSALKVTTAKTALVQLTRQKADDSYDYKEVIKILKDHDITVVTDDNYAVMKVDKIGCEVGGDLSCFSCFKLLGPEGIGAVVGKADLVDKIVKLHYSGGSQVQGFEAMEVLRGLTYAPVLLAIQSETGDILEKRLQSGEVPFVKNAFIANAQSKVLIVELEKPIAPQIIVECEKLGGLPNPVGAESKYELAPMFYRVSGTFLKSDPTLGMRMIRINPNKSGPDTVIRILKKAIENLTN